MRAELDSINFSSHGGRQMPVMKKAAAILIGLALFLSFPSISSAGETSERATANGVGFHITSLHVVVVGGQDEWLISGFAPGIGSFSQGVKKDDIKIEYSVGRASVDTKVLTSLGLTIPIQVNWTVPAGTPQTTQSVAVPNPSRTLTNNFKRATVSGTIGTFTIGVASAAISQRTVTP